MANLSQILQELETEDFIWIVYSFIVLGAIISNVLERDWIIKHEDKSRKEFRFINITIFFVSFLIYLYFVYLNYKHIKETRNNVSLKQLFLQEANFVAACLFLIGGIIYLFTEIFSTTIDTEPDELI
ncbi:MAG: hypothetical protein HFH86_00640 [Bacilli bacterium]|jgi:hypothetical protein|nr:hypothetical protein [Bacilli bacterium]